MLDEILSDLEGIGYTCTPIVIPALAFGANHRRNRVFVLAYSNSIRHIYGQSEIEPAESGIDAQRQSIASGQDVADTAGQRQQRQGKPIKRSREATHGKGKTTKFESGSLGRIWEFEPPVGRVANGIPARVDRLRSLGNAVVPQVAEFVGRCIVEMSNTNP